MRNNKEGFTPSGKNLFRYCNSICYSDDDLSPVCKNVLSKAKVQAAIVAAVDNKQQVKFTIQGMTCEGCEEHVNNELSEVDGVMTYKTSYASKSSLVAFDKSKVDVKTIAAAIKKKGYPVKGYKTIMEKK